jgi:catechol 2,3-dioxygenase-like lactoylglutathione lyase family enzyme
MVAGIEHTAIASPDTERLAHWYVDTLGFVINYQSPSSGTYFVKAPNGSMLEIIRAEGERASQTMKSPGIRHLALTVSDFGEAYGRLKEKNVSFLGEASAAKGVQTVFFTDPDGNILHLIQREDPLP